MSVCAHRDKQASTGLLEDYCDALTAIRQITNKAQEGRVSTLTAGYEAAVEKFHLAALAARKDKKRELQILARLKSNNITSATPEADGRCVVQ